MMLEGRTPGRVRPIISGASLLALTKRCGSVRPIAVGYVWRLLASKVACQAVTPQSVALLAPRQVGFGVASGCEGAIHAARRYTENMQDGQLSYSSNWTSRMPSIQLGVIPCLRRWHSICHPFTALLSQLTGKPANLDLEILQFL